MRTLYARLVRLDLPPGARNVAIYRDPDGLEHVQTEFRECAEGEVVVDAAGVAGRVTWRSARKSIR